MKGGTRLRLGRAKTAKLTSVCGRWADLANFCSDSGFRSRAVVPLRFSGPLVCSGPECSKLAAQQVRRCDDFYRSNQRAKTGWWSIKCAGRRLGRGCAKGWQLVSTNSDKPDDLRALPSRWPLSAERPESQTVRRPTLPRPPATPTGGLALLRSENNTAIQN